MTFNNPVSVCRPCYLPALHSNHPLSSWMLLKNFYKQLILSVDLAVQIRQKINYKKLMWETRLPSFPSPPLPKLSSQPQLDQKYVNPEVLGPLLCGINSNGRGCSSWNNSHSIRSRSSRSWWISVSLRPACSTIASSRIASKATDRSGLKETKVNK